MCLSLLLPQANMNHWDYCSVFSYKYFCPYIGLNLSLKIPSRLCLDIQLRFLAELFLKLQLKLCLKLFDFPLGWFPANYFRESDWNRIQSPTLLSLCRYYQASNFLTLPPLLNQVNRTLLEKYQFKIQAHS